MQFAIDSFETVKIFTAFSQSKPPVLRVVLTGCFCTTFRLFRKNSATRAPQVAFTRGSLDRARACPYGKEQALFRLQPVYFKRTSTLNVPLRAPSFYGVCPSLIALLFYFFGTRSILPGKMRRNQLLLFRHYPRPLRN